MTAADRFDLERFVTAQAPIFETVLAELRSGRKLTHWMWFVFPQLVSLRRGPPFLDRVKGRRLGFRSRRGDRKCPQVRLWAQVWGSVGGTDRGLTI
jgi:hypothetical protein